MATTIRVSVDIKSAVRGMAKISKAVSPIGLDGEMRKVANETYREVRKMTPKKFTGRTRAAWQIKRLSAAKYVVQNRNRVMRFIDGGTRAHGPKRARRMFVPKTKRAFNAGARGVFANPKRFKYGKDYVLARRVRGIKAMKIIDRGSASAKGKALQRFARYVRKSIQ
jgi:hypothetical protein